MTPDEMVERIVQQVGCPLPCMGHDETRRTYREILDVVAAAAPERRQAKPSRFSATPAEIDRYLREIFAEDTYLRYQRTIGNLAVEEAARDIRMETAALKANGVLEFDKYRPCRDAADQIDPAKGGGHYPSQLLCSRHNGFGPCPGAPQCTPRSAGAATAALAEEEIQARVDDLTGQVAGRDETIQRVRDLHKRFDDDADCMDSDSTLGCRHGQGAHKFAICDYDQDDWPCDTIRAIDGDPADDGGAR